MEFEVKPFIYTTKMKALLQILLLTVAFTGCQNHGAKKVDLSSADSILVDSLFKKYQKESKQYIFIKVLLIVLKNLLFSLYQNSLMFNYSVWQIYTIICQQCTPM